MAPEIPKKAGRNRSRMYESVRSSRAAKSVLHSELGRGSTFHVRVAARLADEPILEFELAEEPASPVQVSA